MISRSVAQRRDSHHQGLAGWPGPGWPGPAQPAIGRPGPAMPGGYAREDLAVGLGCAAATFSRLSCTAVGAARWKACETRASDSYTGIVLCVDEWDVKPVG